MEYLTSEIKNKSEIEIPNSEIKNRKSKAC